MLARSLAAAFPLPLRERDRETVSLLALLPLARNLREQVEEELLLSGGRARREARQEKKEWKRRPYRRR